ncbi:phage hyaluronidase [Streptococcus pneumoniae]|uniref:phage tail spike protein n=1 Tax=Streptococcus pneumoniae TaxID=1313 RepID=UPI0005E1F4FB|nr:phage tail spike protein [Streptococcus pneumoniae]CIO73603.1 phage hyaluronidase [Streptococcus pneumoniae]
MLYLLNKDVRTARWNGEPLHEATSAIVKETMNGDFTLTVKYPISDSGIYQLIQEDMLIKAPIPVLGAQLFRIKKPVEHNDHLEITAYHISDDVMQRSITPMSVTSQSCGMTLSRMVQNTKTALGDFSFNSDIQDRRTFNTTETETLYSILLDGKHSIVGTWEGELVRDNFAMTVKKSRGENRGVVITTHKNLKNYQRTKNSQNVVTRIHAKSTFKPEGAEKETTIRVTVDSPLINSYPYINEKEYENNNAKTVEELQKWAQSKFSNEGIDKVSDAIKIEAYELDGQVVHMGDTVNLKSWKHNVDAFKKAIAYEFDALKEEYISLTFDDKAGIGGSRASGGLSSAADAILGVTESAQEIALEKALQNADLDFDHEAGLLRQEISDDIELAKARAEEVKQELSDTINQRFNSFDNGPLKETKRKAEEALRNAGASTLLAQEAKRIGLDSVARLEAFKSQTTSAQMALSGDLDALKRTIANDIRPKQAQAEAEIAKQVEALGQIKNDLAGARTSQARYEETTKGRLAALMNGMEGKANKSEVRQTAETLTSQIDRIQEESSTRISTMTSRFNQRADALDAGVRRLTEGLRTKVDISSLNVTAENIRQSVKSLETNTQDKLDQKLSLAEFEVRAGSIRQEILNATKDKADKTLVVTEAGKLREEFSNLRLGGRNYYRDSEKVRTSTRFFPFPLHPYLTQENVGETWTLSFDLKINEGGEIRPLHFYHYQTNRFGLKASADITPSKEWKRFTFTGSVIFPNDDSRYSRGEMALYDYAGNNNYSVRRIKLEKGTLATDWSPAIEDTDGLITEAKATFERTAQGLRTDLSAIQEYVNKDGQRQEALQRYTREESARQATAVRELVNRDFVGKATYQEDVKGINQRLEAVKTSANKDIASQIASYRQSVDGKFTDISSQITTYKQDVGGQISGLSNRLTSSEQGTTTQISNLSNRINSNKQGTDNQISNLKTQVATNKANADSQFANVTNQLARKVETTDFQRVKETSKLYERILGNSKNGIANTIARMAMTHQLFQVEVSKNDHLKTVQRQLAGSWSVQNINSAGDLISGINLGANGHNRFVGKLTHITGETLIDRAVIKSAMVDKLKTGNFEAGSVTTTILAAEAVTAEKVRFDAAFIRKMTANDAFIDQLTSKRIFSTKVESVISSSTFLEAYQGRIGGFTIGRFAQGRGRWISGINQFSVGMGNGEGGGYNGENTAFWANWGYSWNSPGPNAWYVTTSGNMYCRNGADFHGKVDFSNSSRANFYGNTTFSRSPVFSNGIELGSKDVFGDGWNPKGGRNAVVWWNQVGSGSVKYWMEQKSDRRLKENITDTAVKALDKINRLRMVAFDFIESKKHEEIGLIAQEVETIVPRIVSRDPENPDGYLHIDYTALVPYLIKAIQELNQKIEKMEKTIA